VQGRRDEYVQRYNRGPEVCAWIGALKEHEGDRPSVVTPSVSFSSPNEICRSPSVVFKVKATLRAIGNAAGTIPVVGMAAGAGVGAAGVGGGGAAGVVVVVTGADVAVELVVLLESSGEFEIVDVAILHLLLKPELER
jgi:hypothetical protein